MSARQDEVDRHVARWLGQLDGMDPEVEGAITRMQAVLRRLNRLHQEAAEGWDLTLEDYNTLHALMIQPYPTEATPAQLADTCHVTRAAMTSRVDRVAEAGLVTRTVDPADRRRIIVRPTPKGRRTWERYVVEAMGR
jgi:DNA-binding MarR family transcriptional regulator